MVVIEHVNQRHEHTVLVLVLDLVAAARAVAHCRRLATILGEAARLVRQVRPHPRLAREDLGGEHRRLRNGHRREERGVLAIKVLPPLGHVVTQLGAELSRLPGKRRAIALGQCVRIRAPLAATRSLVYEVGVEHASTSDGLRNVEMPRACKPEAPLPLDIVHHKQVRLCKNALADIRGHCLRCGEHRGFRH